MTHPNIEFAINYLRERGTNIPDEMLEQIRNLGYPLDDKEKKQRVKSVKAGLIHSRAMKQETSYQPVRDNLWAIVYDNVENFLNSSDTVRTFQNEMKRAITEAYSETGDIAYVDGGGSLPVDEETSAMVTSEMNAQLAYVDNLFQTLKALRKEGEFDAIGEAFNAANRWTSSLDGFYNTVKLAGAGNKMLTWNLGDTEQHCDTCSNLDGQRHRASWFISRGFMPHKPGANQDCGGYHCDCSLTDDNGEEFTI